MDIALIKTCINFELQVFNLVTYLSCCSCNCASFINFSTAYKTEKVSDRGGEGQMSARAQAPGRDDKITFGKRYLHQPLQSPF